MRVDWCVSSWFRIKNTHSHTERHPAGQISRVFFFQHPTNRASHTSEASVLIMKFFFQRIRI